MAAKRFYNAAHFAESFQRFDDLRESKETCDIRLLASNKEILAHKLVLSSASEYFKNAIYGLLSNNSGKEELELKEVQYEVLSAIINYMYTGKIDIDSENVYDIYDAADYCLMNFLKEKCFEFLEENLHVENCVKIWVMANTCKHDKLMTAAANFTFSKFEPASNSKEFFSLSKEEILDLFKIWPKDKLLDTFITSLLKWAAGKQNWEGILMTILKDVPHTRISENYLETFLSKHEFIENSLDCNKWMMNIYIEKSKLHKLERAEFEAELKFSRFGFDHSIIFLDCCLDTFSNSLYKYNLHDGSFNQIKCRNYSAFDCQTYKKWIYVLEEKYCQRFSFDGLRKNEYEIAFNHNHDVCLTSAVLNDTMYIFGGLSSKKRGSSIDLNTKQDTRFSLLHDRVGANAVVNHGSIYICAGARTNTIERFDPREGRTTGFGCIPFMKGYLTASLTNELYCTDGIEYKMIDLRNNSTCVQIDPPVNGFAECSLCLVSSYGKLYTITTAGTIHEYNNVSGKWQSIASFSELSQVFRATSFE